MTALAREAMVARARSLAPVVAERAAKCEELRRVPEETFQDFRDAGLLGEARRGPPQNEEIP